MDVWEAIIKRRTVRNFSRVPVEFDKIAMMIEAGTYAPSSGNLQNWKFIVVTDKNIIKDIHNYCLDQVWINTAPVLIIVCGLPELAAEKYGIRGERLYTTQNVAAAIENMILVAETLDLGTAWIGAFDEEKIKNIFGIPENVRAQAIIAVGYSDYETPEKIMQPLDSQVYFNAYGMNVRRLDITLYDYHVRVNEIAKDVSGYMGKSNTKAAKVLKEKFEEFKKNVRELMNLK